MKGSGKGDGEGRLSLKLKINHVYLQYAIREPFTQMSEFESSITRYPHSSKTKNFTNFEKLGICN